MSFFINVILLYLSIENCFPVTICLNSEDTYFTTPDVIREHGYREETHEVMSKNGYLLTLHRIPQGRFEIANNHTRRKKPVVVLYHGIGQTSIHWLLIGTNNSLGFMLADEGFDVWLANLRGNCYSNKHANMTKKDPAYWEFSFHEMGDEDLISEIDHILNYTGQSKLFLIGYNLGNTVIYAGLSLHPDYNAKVRLIISLAPLAYLKNAQTPWMTAAHQPALSLFFEMLKLTFGITTYPISEADIPVWQSFFKEFCGKENVDINAICSHFSYIGFGMDFQHVATNTAAGKVIPTTPALTSFKTAIHLAQIASSTRFQWFDQRIKNMDTYYAFRPPSYRIYNIRTPIALLTAPNDPLSHPLDIEALTGSLPNVYENYSIPSTKFTHRDFLYSFQAADLVYRECIKLIKDFVSNATLGAVII